MRDSPSRKRLKPATDRTWRNRLVGMPRRAKQLLMLITDAIGMYCCVLGVAWVYLIRPLPRVDFFLLAFCTMLVAHVVARHLGFYHSIVRYLGMGLLLAGAQVAAVSAIVLATGGWLMGLTSTPLRRVLRSLSCRQPVSGSVLSRAAFPGQGKCHCLRCW